MAKNEIGQGKPVTFLSIDFKTGLLYEAKKSTDNVEIGNLEKNGFQRVVNINPQTKQEVVSYRKYYGSVSGYINEVKVKESPFGQNLNIRIEDKSEINYISIPLWDVRGSMAGYAVDFVRLTANIPLDERVCLGANKKLKNDGGYLVQLLNMTYEERITEGRNDLIKRLDKELVPPMEITTIGTKKSYDTKKRDAYLYGLLEEFIKKVEENKFVVPRDGGDAKVAYVPEATSPAESAKQDVPPAAYTPGPAVNQSEIEDLPF